MNKVIQEFGAAVLGAVLVLVIGVVAVGSLVWPAIVLTLLGLGDAVMLWVVVQGAWSVVWFAGLCWLDA